MLQTRRWLFAACLAVVALFAWQAIAQDEEAQEMGPPVPEPMGPMMDEDAPPPPMPHERPLMKLRALNQALQDVQLNDQQKQQIDGIRQQYRQQMQQWRQQHKSELQNLRQQMQQLRQQHQPQMQQGRELWKNVRQLLESNATGPQLEQQVGQLRQQYKQVQQERQQARQQMQPLQQQWQKLMATAPPAQPVIDQTLKVLTDQQRPIVDKRMQEIESERPGMMGQPGMMGPGHKGEWGKGPKGGPPGPDNDMDQDDMQE